MVEPDSLDINSRRFEVRRRLGSGGMGDVYEAFDRETGWTVALKTLRRLDGESLYRFKNEFRALADVNHPNLVTLYELLNLGEEWVFTMEFVEGVHYLAYVRHRAFDGGNERRAPQRQPWAAAMRRDTQQPA